MDVPPIAGVTPERPAFPSPSGPASDASHRLASIEAGLAELGERLDALAVSFEASVRTAVAEEVQTASADLRHTVSELGRLLVRDLGRLSKILGEHRDSIVADLRPPAPGSPPPRGPERAEADGRPDQGSPGDAAQSEPPATGYDVAGDGPDGTGDAGPEEADGGERQRRTLLRRRQP